MSFGTWLRAQRGRQTQAALAAAIGLKKGTISAIEQGTTQPSHVTLWRLGEVLGWSAIDYQEAVRLLGLDLARSRGLDLGPLAPAALNEETGGAEHLAPDLGRCLGQLDDLRVELVAAGDESAALRLAAALGHLDDLRAQLAAHVQPAPAADQAAAGEGA